MPTLRNRTQQPSPLAPQVELPANFPKVPQEILDRFPSAAQWQTQLDEFWERANAAIQQSQQQAATYANARVVFSVDQFLIYAKNGIPQPMFALDSTGVKLGNVLVINTPGLKVYIGEGVYADDGTPFYIDATGRFSLGSSLAWDPETDTLTIVGVINATSGTIGGFEIGTDYIRDTANTFGLASTITAGNDVRLWAGATFANRTIAPFHVHEDGEVEVLELDVSGVAVFFGNIVGQSALIHLNGSITNTGGAALAITTSLISQNPFVFPLYGISVEPTFNKNGTAGISAASIYINAHTAAAQAPDITYGIYLDDSSAAATRWALYVATTAKNYLAGALQIASLAGVGSRTVVADSSGNLSAP